MFRILLILSLILFSCQNPPKETESKKAEETAPLQKNISLAQAFTAPISKAHGLEAFQQEEAIAFDIQLFFRGKKRFAGTIISSTSSDRIRMEREDGAALIYDGEKVWLTPDTASWKSARFDIFTWQYFALAPFKLQDPGTYWQELRRLPLFPNTNLQTAKLTFSEDTGDAPDDWYVAYQDSMSRLAGLAYIVTFSKDQAEAEKAPHAITYHEHQQIGKVQFASAWKFWDWSEEGLADQLGEAQLSNIQFVPRADYDFGKGESSLEITR
ncbi:MAG: hypothetical protein AB8F95_08600 [Bacteroidia bacterium]